MMNFPSALMAPFRLWRRQWDVDDDESGPAVLAFLIRVSTIIAVFHLIDRSVRFAVRIPLENYGEPVIAWQLIQHLVGTGYGVLFLPALAVLLLRPGLALSKWSALDGGAFLRFLFLVAGGILTWNYSTYDVNVLVDQTHYPDRLLLLGLFALCVWRPLFALFYIVFLPAMIWQFKAFGLFSWAAPSVPMRVIEMIAAFFIVFLLVRRVRRSDLVFLVCCLVAAHYWPSGLAKFDWSWITTDQIHLMVPSSYASGWLSSLEPETISSMTRSLSLLNWPMKIFTLVVEFGVLCFVWHRWTVRFFLLAWIAFHVGIFLTSGILFWMWMAIEAALLWLLFRRPGFRESFVFSRSRVVVSTLLILTASVWCRPVVLEWRDVPMKYAYRFTGEARDGEKILLPPKFFAPFDYHFTLGTFDYLSSRPTLNFVNISEAERAEALYQLRSKEEFLEFEKSYGQGAFDEKRKEKLSRFIRDVVSHWNRQPTRGRFLEVIQPPRLLHTFPTKKPYSKAPITKVTLHRVTTFFDGTNYEEFDRELLTEIEIPE